MIVFVTFCHSVLRGAALAPWESRPSILEAFTLLPVPLLRDDRCSGFQGPSCCHPLQGDSVPSLLLPGSPGPRRQQTLCSSISGRCPELRDSWRNVSEACRVLSSGLRVNTGGRGCRPLFPRHLREAAKSLRFRLSLSQRRSPNAARRKEIVHFIFPAQVCLSFDFQWNWPGVRCLFHGETHSCRLAQMVVNLGRLQTRGFSPRHE